MQKLTESSGAWRMVQKKLLNQNGWRIRNSKKSPSGLNQCTFKKGNKTICVKEVQPRQPPVVVYTINHNERPPGKAILVFVIAVVQYYECVHNVRVAGFYYEKKD